MNTVTLPRRRGRPPKIHPGFAETREALLRAGVISLTERGFSSTAVDGILDAVGIPKGSFYHYFDSKEAFGAELIARYSLLFARRLDGFLSNRALQPLDRIRAFIADAEAAMARHGFRRGCLVGNLGQEMGALPEAYRVLLIEALKDWQTRTARCLREAPSDGERPGIRDCDQWAAFFWIGWEGAVLRSKLEKDRSALRAFAAGFFALVETGGRRER